MSNSVYLAGPWQEQAALVEMGGKLQAAGYTVTSRWLDAGDVADDDPERETLLKQQAVNDIEDLLTSDAMIYVNSARSEGKATELGMAIATLKPIILIGAREHNIFLHLNMPAFPTIEEAIVWMQENP